MRLKLRKILERKCNDFLIHIEQLSSGYEDLKRRFFQTSGPQQRGEAAKYEEKISMLNQNLMENEKRMEELLEENESLKRKATQEMNAKARLEEDRKQLNVYADQLKMDAQ